MSITIHESVSLGKNCPVIDRGGKSGFLGTEVLGAQGIELKLKPKIWKKQKIKARRLEPPNPSNTKRQSSMGDTSDEYVAPAGAAGVQRGRAVASDEKIGRTRRER